MFGTFAPTKRVYMFILAVCIVVGVYCNILWDLFFWHLYATIMKRKMAFQNILLEPSLNHVCPQKTPFNQVQSQKCSLQTSWNLGFLYQILNLQNAHDNLDLPISITKGKHVYCTHPISSFYILWTPRLLSII